MTNYDAPNRYVLAFNNTYDNGRLRFDDLPPIAVEAYQTVEGILRNYGYGNLNAMLEQFGPLTILDLETGQYVVK